MAAVLLATVTALPGQVVDVPRAKDIVRSGDDITVNVSQPYSDVLLKRVVPEAKEMADSLRAVTAKPDGVLNPKLAKYLVSSGVPFISQDLQITLRSKRAESIRVIDIQPVVVDRKAPLQGALYYLPGEAQEQSVPLNVNFDSTLPVVRDGDGLTRGSRVRARPYFARRTILLKDRESIVLQLHLVSLRNLVDYNLRIDYLLGDRRRSTTVDDQGEPFALTGGRCASTGRMSYRQVFVLGEDYSLQANPNPEDYPAPNPEMCEGGGVYANLLDLRDAAVGAGLACPNWRRNDPEFELESGTCSDTSKLILSNNVTSLEQAARQLRSSSGPSSANSHIRRGGNWLIFSPAASDLGGLQGRLVR